MQNSNLRSTLLEKVGPNLAAILWICPSDWTGSIYYYHLDYLFNGQLSNLVNNRALNAPNMLKVDSFGNPLFLLMVSTNEKDQILNALQLVKAESKQLLIISDSQDPSSIHSDIVKSGWSIQELENIN